MQNVGILWRSTNRHQGTCRKEKPDMSDQMSRVIEEVYNNEESSILSRDSRVDEDDSMIQLKKPQ
jgi:hypothetical protein